jgi:DNA-binding CsgD family transcriptional regulator
MGAAAGASRDLEGIGLGMGGVALALLGRGREATARLAVLPDRAADFPMEATDALVVRGAVNVYIERLQEARADLQLAVSRQRSGVPLRFSGQSVGYLGETEFRLGAWDDAVVHTELAVSLCRDADRVYDLPFVHGYAAFVPANRGEWDVAESHIAIAWSVAELSGVPLHVAMSGWAAAFLAAARSDPVGVLAATGAIRAAGQLDTAGRPGVYDWRPMEIDALIETGRLDDAQAALDEFQAAIPDGGLRSANVALARLAGGLAAARGDLAAARERFAEAWKESERLEKPFDLALLALADARRLRQAGERREAITRLRTGRERFSTLRARPYIEKCDRELEQCGVPADPAAPGVGFGLTPAELAVARLVATGKSNRDTAAELYVTVKTVEFHLRGVFAKLGVTSRREIAARLSG